MGKPTEEELKARHARINAVNNMGNAPALTTPSAAGQIGQGNPAEEAGGSGIGAVTTPPPVTNETTQSQTAPPQEGAPAQDDPLMKDRKSPEEMIQNMPIGDGAAGIERSIKSIENGNSSGAGALDQDSDLAAANVAEQKNKINEGLVGSGVNPEAALKSLQATEMARVKAMVDSKQIPRKVYTDLKERWKNIFNIIPKEDMGLVLMDFGFRAMIAGETMSDAGALGAAGMGALQGVGSRREAETQQEMAMMKMANEEGRANMETITAAETAGKKGAELKDTQDGVMEYIDGNWEYQIRDGKRVMPSALAGRPPTDKWKIDQLVGMGMDSDKAKRFILLGQDPSRAKEIAFAAWNAFERDQDATITIGDTTYTKRDVKTGAIPELKRKFFNEALAILGIAPEDRGPAMSGGGDGGAALSGDGRMTRAELAKEMQVSPDKVTNDMWDEYNAFYDSNE